MFFAAVGLTFVLFGLGDMASGGSTYESGEAVLFNAITVDHVVGATGSGRPGYRVAR